MEPDWTLRVVSFAFGTAWRALLICLTFRGVFAVVNSIWNPDPPDANLAVGMLTLASFAALGLLFGVLDGRRLGRVPALLWTAASALAGVGLAVLTMVEIDEELRWIERMGLVIGHVLVLGGACLTGVVIAGALVPRGSTRRPSEP
jgi:hypothetical protein